MEEYLNAWTPVKTQKGNKHFSVEVWGRCYDFDASPFPTQITSLGKQLLYAPIKLTPVFGEKEETWQDFSYETYSANDEKAVFVTSAVAGNVVCDTAVTAEYDGFVKIDLKIMSSWQFSDPVPKLTGLYLDIPVKKECASLMHYWPNDRQSIIPAGNVMNSGKTHDMVFPFKPYISLGNNEVGLGVFCGESDKNFMLNDADKCIEVSDKGEYVNIRLTFLEHMPQNWLGRNDRWVSALKPITYTVGFHATPVKPMRKSDEVYKIAHTNDCMAMQKENKINENFLAELKNAGTKWLVLHEEWSAIQNYGFPYNTELIKKFIKECHARGIKVMVYFGYEYSSLHPEWTKNAENYLIKTTDGEFTGGWQRKPHQRDYMVCYHGGYSDEMISRVCYVMDELGVDGIYTDGTFVPWECANTAHGCGYTDKNGNLHTAFPVLAVREHVKKLYKEVHKRGGIIDTHQSSCCLMPTLAFCDSYYDGENIQGMLNKDDMSFLNMDAFRAEYMGSNFGIPANFIAYTNETRPIQTLSALTLLHNVHCRPGALHHEEGIADLGYCSKIWHIFDEYDLNNAKWYPYWDTAPVTAEGSAYVSVYETLNAMVAVCADFSDAAGHITLDLPGGTKSVKNLLTGEVFAVEGSKAQISTKMSELNILLIEK